ncbi:efflux RND transporter permease subunit [Desulfocurvibacter africanus]|uniref:efflux RND transporter permease subunit n=1 Tax=Desulfocurvibacter africanus TaxID=873 RepID=UPI0003F9BF27|nr:efflux RND transporter permease subunit [Desulfocurvibacter africanus]
MIWNFCISRPVLTIVGVLVTAIFGIYGYYQMPVREDPDVEFPIVSVNVVFPGAEPEVVETEIIEPLEEEINTVEGLKTLTSTAREEVATVTAEFELWRDIDVAAQDVRDRVSRARRELPDGIEEPIIEKLDPDAQAVLWIALTGDTRWDEVRLSTYADEVLRQRLENLRGVGRIIIGGERRYAVRIELDPLKLAAHRLTVQDVVEAVQANNVDIPSGRVESVAREFLVKTRGQLSEAEPFNELIVASRDGGPVRVRDVGQAVDGVENDRQIARFVGETAVGMGVVKLSGANTVSLAEGVKARMEELARDFPAGLDYQIASDESVFIEESIRDLLFTIGLTSGLVVLVVLLFLRTFRGTLIVGLAIPASLLGGLAVMNVLGFSVNTLTMLGLILAIGIVIDDAIVVLESSYRHLEQGADPVPAARVGTTEVAFPSIANTLSLAAVFIPVAFTPGLIGRFFYEFGLTVAATVIASTLTALTLTPMLCSRLLHRNHKRGRIFHALERGFEIFEAAYARSLDVAMAARWLTVLLALAAFGLGAFLFTRLSTEFQPEVDRAEFMISFETPEGATLGQTDLYAREIEKVLRATPEVRQFFLAIALSRGGGPGRVNDGISFVRLHSAAQRGRHQSEIMQELRRELSLLPGGRAFVFSSGGSGIGGEGAPLQLVLQNPDIDALAAAQEQVMAWMNQRQDLIGVNTNLKLNKPQVEVDILRDKATQMGISVLELSNALRFLLGEPDISEIERASERYEVIPEVVGKGGMVPDDIKRIYVRNQTGALVSMDNLVELTETVGPSEIHHFNRLRSATVSASTPPDVALGDPLAALQDWLDENLPDDFSFEFTGQTRDFQESFFYLSITIVFSVIFIYLVLAAQFESFVNPLIILTALPLAGVGAAGALWLLDMPLGIYAFIGLIMLAGMATKNAILMLDYAGVLQARGESARKAAMDAAHVRFRPVIMTTMSTVLGMLPIALGFGAGGEARAPMGVAVASGLLVTTFLTLIVLPVVYTLTADLRVWLTRRKGRAEED